MDLGSTYQNGLFQRCEKHPIATRFSGTTVVLISPLRYETQPETTAPNLRNPRLFRFNHNQQVTGFDSPTWLHEDIADLAIKFCVDHRFHLHGFKSQQFLALFDSITDLYGHCHDHAGHRRSNLT